MPHRLRLEQCGYSAYQNMPCPRIPHFKVLTCLGIWYIPIVNIIRNDEWPRIIFLSAKSSYGVIVVGVATNGFLGIRTNIRVYALSAKAQIGTGPNKQLGGSNLMSCNVAQYLPSDDSPVTEIERIVHSKMVAQQGRRRGRGRAHFLPPQDIEFIITTQEGYTLHLTGYCVPEVEECHLGLHHGSTVLRKFEAHEGHVNPRRRNHPITRIHMHFPSINFPLVMHRSSYAYSIDEDGFDDVAECLEFFCAELSIELGGWQPRLR